MAGAEIWGQCEKRMHLRPKPYFMFGEGGGVGGGGGFTQP
jgi:hypothetical protein